MASQRWHVSATRGVGLARIASGHRFEIEADGGVDVGDPLERDLSRPPSPVDLDWTRLSSGSSHDTSATSSSKAPSSRTSDGGDAAHQAVVHTAAVESSEAVGALGSTELVPAEVPEALDQLFRLGENAVADASGETLAPLLGLTRQTSSSSHATSHASSAQQYADPGQTLIFFDWDDTLFPTTEVFKRRGVPLSRDAWKAELPPDLESDLALWRGALYQYLCIACSLSERVAIVTNSSRPWVDHCVDRFAPSLRQLLDDTRGVLRVVYTRKGEHNTGQAARTSKEGKRRVTDLKLEAMKAEAVAFYSRYPAQTWKNILSVGDMKYEHDAVQQLTSGRRAVSLPRERVRTKALLLPGSPSLSELTLRLQFSSLMLPVYVRFDGDIDLDLRAAPDPLQAIATALNMPHLGHLPFPRHAWGRTPMPKGEMAAEALDEVALTVHETLELSASGFASSSHLLSEAGCFEEAPATAGDERALDGSEGQMLATAAYGGCVVTGGKRLALYFMRGVSEGALATVATHLISLRLMSGQARAAQELVGFCYAVYSLLVATSALRTVSWMPASRDSTSSDVCGGVALAPDAQMPLLSSEAECRVAAAYQRCTGYLFADAAYVVFSSRLGRQPQRLAHHGAQSVVNLICLVRERDRRSSLCVLAASNFVVAVLGCTRLALVRCGSPQLSERLRLTFVVPWLAAKFALIAWCWRLMWAASRFHGRAGSVQLTCAGCAQLLRIIM